MEHLPRPPHLPSLPPALAGARRAGSWRTRLLGLMFVPGAAAPPALLLSPCRSVHTCFMRFPLDLVWLSASGRVLRVDRAVPPWRVRTCRRARAVVEVPRSVSAAGPAAPARAPSDCRGAERANCAGKEGG